MSYPILPIFFGLFAFVSFQVQAINISHNYGQYIEIEHFLFDTPPSRPSGIPYTSAVSKYGKAVVKSGEIKFKLDKRPWSSWWYPKYDTQIFRENEGQKSTLERYDEYALKRGRYKGSTRDFEEKNIYDPHSTKWSGLCHAWAMAAIMEEEPVSEVYKNGIRFRVQDLKALLIKTYENAFPAKVFGQRNNGSYGNIYEDIYPEQMHTIIQKELFEKKNPFVMDFDAGFQVWNVPVFGARVRVTKDLDNPQVVHVSTLLNTASPFVEDPNFTGTKTENFLYTYDLYGEWIGDEFVVDYGLWTEQSRKYHPDFIAVKPKEVKRESNNPYIDTKLVDEILRRSW